MVFVSFSSCLLKLRRQYALCFTPSSLNLPKLLEPPFLSSDWRDLVAKKAHLEETNTELKVKSFPPRPRVSESLSTLMVPNQQPVKVTEDSFVYHLILLLFKSLNFMANQEVLFFHWFQQPPVTLRSGTWSFYTTPVH